MRKSPFSPNLFASLLALAILGAALIGLHCTEKSVNTTLAPYEGQRALAFLKITQHYRPEFNWVGGRIAAAGVNKGTRAALDSTLVWLSTTVPMRAVDTLTMGNFTDTARMRQYHAKLLDSLPSPQVYTFWLATTDAFSHGLDSAHMTPYTFVDSTMTIKYMVAGLYSGEQSPGITFTVRREQHLTYETYVVSWKPVTRIFRRIALRVGNGGAFTDLLWHAVTLDSLANNIKSPVYVGLPLDGTTEAVPWLGEALELDKYVYFFFLTDKSWNLSFNVTPTTKGYCGFRTKSPQP